jgi:predicted dehydrogenase
MMAETVVYSREYLFIKEMYEKGELGKVQYMQASHPQDMDGWPDYWERMIPMHYATHVVSPVLGLIDGRAEQVSCYGSGRVRDDIAEKSGNKFAVESCQIKIANSDVAAHIWRTLYDTARQYRESFDVYGTKKSFEWTLSEGQPHVLHTAKRPEPEIAQPVDVHSVNRRRRSSVVRPRRRAWWFPSPLSPRVCQRFARGSSTATGRNNQCQLDVRRYLCTRIGTQRRRDCQASRVYVGLIRDIMRVSGCTPISRPAPDARLLSGCRQQRGE